MMTRFLFSSCLLFVGCTIDEPVCFAPRPGAPPATRLSELGLISDVDTLTPGPGVLPYQVALPLYADGADKHRWLWLPPDTHLSYSEDRWGVPVGARFVKTFVLSNDAGTQETRIETRLLERTQTGFREGTYLWNAEQTDAECSGGNVDVALPGLVFHVPGTSRCETCHLEGENSHALGLRTRQMNVGGQIDALVDAGVLDRADAPALRASLPDPFGDAPLDQRAQAYLDVNCGNCHFDQGYAAGTGVFFDLGHALENACRKTGAVQGRTVVISPGRSSASELIARMQSTNPFVHMPQGPSHVPDEPGIALVAEWIDSLPVQECEP
jgi:hypothetical protein